MYSGSDSNESLKHPRQQWSLNPTTYQNMSNDQVDWAALAQQWIIMKESGPPPVPGAADATRKRNLLKKEEHPEVEEAGEAPMDVENEKEEEITGAPIWNVNEPPPPPGAEPWAWNNQGQNWNWNNSWMPPSVVPPPPNIGPLKGPLLPTPNNLFNTAPPESVSDNAVNYGGYNTLPGDNFQASGGYWTASGAAAASSTPPGVPKHIKPHNKRYSKVNVPVRVTAPLPPANVAVMDTAVPVPAPQLDAAKRKQLPAWIREGLEKMEKDKLKEMEREKLKREREEIMEKNKEMEQETMEILKSTMIERQRSRFDSDGENSQDDAKNNRSNTPEAPPLTHDELMIKVRRMMTEILLNVTNKLIDSVCKEELQRYIRKLKASDQRTAAPRGGADISARLGLGAYGQNSDSSEDGEEEEEEEEERENSNRKNKDSDEELKETIRRKVTDFQKIEREIDEKLDKKQGNLSRSSTPETDNSHITQDKKRGSEEKPHSPASTYSTPSTGSRSSSDSGAYKRNRSRRSPEKSRRNSYRKSRTRSPRKRKSSRRSRSRSRSSSHRRRSRRSRSRSRRRGSRSSSRSRYSRRGSVSSRRRRRSRCRSRSGSRGKRSHRH